MGLQPLYMELFHPIYHFFLGPLWKNKIKNYMFQQPWNYPIGSMYGIFTYVWLIFMVNVGKYTIRGSCGYGPLKGKTPPGPFRSGDFFSGHRRLLLPDSQRLRRYRLVVLLVRSGPRVISCKYTLPETNSSHLQMGHSKRTFIFQQLILRGHVNFREGIGWNISIYKGYSSSYPFIWTFLSDFHGCNEMFNLIFANEFHTSTTDRICQVSHLGQVS